MSTLHEPASVSLMPAARDGRDRAKPSAGSMGLVALCFVVIAIGVAAQTHGYLGRGSLWEDELIAITHANQPLPLFFIQVLRNDIHPPLYFLQLDAWMALGSNTDAWALANSLFWAAVSLVVMFGVAKRVHGIRAAWIATALLAVLPSFVWSASTLRMYAALPAFVLTVYFANRRWFDTRDARFLVLAFATALLTAYVHAIEFFFVVFIAFGAFLEAVAAGRLRPTAASSTGPLAVPGASLQFSRALWTWLIVQSLLGLCLLPLAGSGLLRGSDASAPSSAVAMLTLGGSLVAGWKTSSLPWARGAGTVIFLMLTVAALSVKDSRWRTIGIPIAVLVVATLVALGVKPIFKQPVFAANLLPFVVIGAAAAAARSRCVMTFLVAPCLVVLALVAFPMVDRQAQSEGYAAAARAVRDRATPGDLVVVPSVSVFWGVARYAVGPEWGSPLAVMPPPNAEWAGLNERLARTFGTSVPQRLGLVPARHVVDAGGVRYLIGDDAVAESATAPHVWLVTRQRYVSEAKLDAGLRASTSFAPLTFGDGELTVRRFDRVDPSTSVKAPLSLVQGSVSPKRGTP